MTLIPFSDETLPVSPAHSEAIGDITERMAHENIVELDYFIEHDIKAAAQMPGAGIESLLWSMKGSSSNFSNLVHTFLIPESAPVTRAILGTDHPSEPLRVITGRIKNGQKTLVVGGESLVRRYVSNITPYADPSEVRAGDGYYSEEVSPFLTGLIGKHLFGQPVRVTRDSHRDDFIDGAIVALDIDEAGSRKMDFKYNEECPLPRRTSVGKLLHTISNQPLFREQFIREIIQTASAVAAGESAPDGMDWLHLFNDVDHQFDSAQGWLKEKITESDGQPFARQFMYEEDPSDPTLSFEFALVVNALKIKPGQSMQVDAATGEKGVDLVVTPIPWAPHQSQLRFVTLHSLGHELEPIVSGFPTPTNRTEDEPANFADDKTLTKRVYTAVANTLRSTQEGDYLALPAGKVAVENS